MAGRTSTMAGATSTAAGATSTMAGATSAPKPLPKPENESSILTSVPSGKLSFAEFEKAAKKLKMLLDNGIINQEEFDAEKQKLVANMEI